MIVSRCLSIARLSTNVAKNLLVQNGNTNISHQIKRHKKYYYYRSSPTEGDEGTRNKFLYELLGASVWWWVLWHLFTDYHELLPVKFPDPSKWTDEELGVPPLEG